MAGSAESPRKIRNNVIQAASATHGYLLAEFARTAGLHYSTISRIVNGR
jgi:hypothetical protein